VEGEGFAEQAGRFLHHLEQLGEPEGRVSMRLDLLGPTMTVMQGSWVSALSTMPWTSAPLSRVS
jgi:hypothetical protein